MPGDSSERIDRSAIGKVTIGQRVRMLTRTKPLFLAGGVALTWAVFARGPAAAPWNSHSDLQAKKSESAAATLRTIRVRVFVDDVEQQLGSAQTLEIRSGATPVELNWVNKSAMIVGDLSAPCSFRFKRGNEEARFNGVGAHLFRCGGELIVAFIKKPALLHKEVSLVDGEAGRVEAFAAYDDARATVSRAWRKLSKEERKRVRRAVFYHFTPDTDYDPVVETGHYFELPRR